ncbi:MAG: glycosyltransferase family 39 protein [Candidatus Vogelbacteria bacterium]|nr:glycosyltransferase family 39 protein [Candidatus Vogelbacteria bacterium]
MSTYLVWSCRILLLVAFLVGIFLSTYKLTVSPPTWKDEGIIVQVAQNISRHGVYGVQVAPQEFVPAGFVTTGYTVILPVALFLKVFGEGLLQARSIMAIYLFCFFLLVYLLIKRGERCGPCIWAVWLLVSFAPLYGSGKSVLGEIPGTVFFLAFILCLRMIEVKYRGWWPMYLGAGIMAGLSMVTKPLFLIVVPVAVVLDYVDIKSRLPLKNILVSIFWTVVTVIAWVFVQFPGDSLYDILAIYSGNLSDVPLPNLIAENIYNTLTSLQPLYFLGLIVIWAVSLLWRKMNKEHVYVAESVAFYFSLVSLLAYLKTVGYFRYFLPGQIVALVYLPNSLFYLAEQAPSKLRVRFSFILLAKAILVILIIFQFYKTFFDSWVSDYYQITQTTDLGTVINSISADKKVLFCNVPEAVTFFGGRNYYQYVEFADIIKRGDAPSATVSRVGPDMIVVADRCPLVNNSVAGGYKVSAEAGKYRVLDKIK